MSASAPAVFRFLALGAGCGVSRGLVSESMVLGYAEAGYKVVQNAETSGNMVGGQF